MKYTFVTTSSSSNSPGQQIVTVVTEDPLRDVSLPPRSRTSRAKKLLVSLRNFTSAGPTPTASPNRGNQTNGLICRIPRACCRYNSPENHHSQAQSPVQLRLSQNSINKASMDGSSGVQNERRRTESDSSPGNIDRFILDIRRQKWDQGSLNSGASSVIEATNSQEHRSATGSPMSSVPKSLTDPRRTAPITNGGAPRIADSADSLSRKPTRPLPVPNAHLVAQQQQQQQQQQQKTVLGVFSPPAQRHPAVRRGQPAPLSATNATTSQTVQQQGNPTYTLIAYQPGQDAHRKNPNQPAVLYAIPSNHSLIQHHQLQQIIQQQQKHSLQPTPGVVAPAAATAMLVPSTRQGQVTGLTHSHLQGVCQQSHLMQQSQQRTTTVSTTTSAVTGGHRPGELVCTCPPEVHQALIEQHQQRQLQQQQQQGFLLINRDQAAVRLSSDAAHNANSNLHGDRTLNAPDGVQVQCVDGQRAVTVGGIASPDSDAESHVNYLVTLFQVLKTSGVREESFLSAFRLMGFSPTLTGPKRDAAVRAKKELHGVRGALSNLKKEHMQMKSEFGKEIQCCEKLIAVQLKKYERRKGLQQIQPFYDSRIHKVRSDRKTLDNALVAYQTTWSSLIGQLADLEGVIEETGNDVLKGRCRITLQMVSALEDRLQLATSAIEFCCENDPLLRKSIWQHAENEMDSAEQEIRILEEQLEQLSDLRERSSRLNGTIMTLKRLAKVNTSARQNDPQAQRLRSIGGVLNPTAGDAGSAERKRLITTIRLLQPDHDERMRSIEIQEALRERRKRVFRDPPVFKGAAQALLLNAIHINPIWPEGFSRRSHRNTTTTSEPPDSSSTSEDPPEVPNTTASVPQPLRLPLSNVLVSRLKSPNTQRSKQNVHVKFNTRVYVDGEDKPLPLNCIPEEDNGNYGKRKSVPALPSPEEATPPAPPPRLSSNSISPVLSNDPVKSPAVDSPAKMLRYENIDVFLKNVQQRPNSERNNNQPQAQS